MFIINNSFKGMGWFKPKTVLDTVEIKNGKNTVLTRWQINNIDFKEEFKLHFSFQHKIKAFKLFGIKFCDISSIKMLLMFNNHPLTIPIQWDTLEQCWSFDVNSLRINGEKTSSLNPCLLYIKPKFGLNLKNDLRIECKGQDGEEWTLTYFAKRYLAYTNGAVESIQCEINKIDESKPAEVAVYIDGRLYNHYITNNNRVMIEFRQSDKPVKFDPINYTPLSVLDFGTFGTKAFTHEMMCSSIFMYRTNMQIGVKNCNIVNMVEGAFIPMNDDFTLIYPK